jgi:hypothetical protein
LLGIVVVLLEGGEPGSAVVLGTTAALLIAEVLAGVRREETWIVVVRYMNTEPDETLSLTNMLSILAAALHLGLVVRLRELLLLAGQLRPGPIARIVQLNVSARFLMQQ